MNLSKDKRVKLDMVYSFGSTTKNIEESCQIYVEDDYRHAIYPTGKHIAIECIERNNIDYIKLSSNLHSIKRTLLDSSKQLLMVVEVVETQEGLLEVIHFYPIKNYLKNTKVKDEQVKQYHDKQEQFKFLTATFSGDSRYVAILSQKFNEIDQKIVVIDIIKNCKEIVNQVFTEFQIDKLHFNPKDSSLISISGLKTFKVMKVSESTLVPVLDQIKKLPACTITTHNWLDPNKIILGTDRTEIFIINYKDKEIVQAIKFAYEKPNTQYNLEMKYIQVFSKGFVCVSSYNVNCNTKFSIWLKNDDSYDSIPNSQGKYIHLRDFASNRNSECQSIDISQQEEYLAFSFKNNDIATLDIKKITPQIPETIESCKKNQKWLEKNIKFQFLHKGFHCGEISSIDVCLQRPLVVTCCQEDNSIRVWNYLKNECELVYAFVEDKSHLNLYNPNENVKTVLTAAIHPNGYYLAIGTVNSLEMKHLLHKELKLYKELTTLKHCSKIAWSNSGELLLTCSQKPKTSIFSVHIINAYTLQILHVLKQVQVQINSLSWYYDDSRILYGCIDGQFFEYEWEPALETANKLSEKEWRHNSKYLKFQKEHKNSSNIVYNYSLNACMISSCNNKQSTVEIQSYKGEDIRYNQKLIQNSHKFNTEISAFTYLETPNNIYQVITGSKNGQLMVHNSILTERFFEYPVHSGSITQIVATKDSKYLFTGGDDGCLYIHQIQEQTFEGRQIIQDIQKEEINNYARKFLNCVDSALSDVVLVQRNEIDKYLKEQKQLKTQYEDLENKMELQSQDEKKRMTVEINLIKNKVKQEIQNWSKRYEELKAQKGTIEKESTNLLQNMENNHLKAVEELEALYERKLTFENEKYLQQEQAMLEQGMSFDKKLKELEHAHEDGIEELRNRMEDNTVKAKTSYEKTWKEAEKLQKEFKESLAQNEEEHEQEIRELNEKYKQQLEREKIKNSELRREMECYKQDHKLQADEVEVITNETNSKGNEIRQLKGDLKMKEDEISNKNSEILNFQAQIKKKDQKIHEYKYKISDLQKKVHVLSYRTSEMHKSLEPKETQIEKLKEELFRLEQEFEMMNKNMKKLHDKNDKLQNQLETMTKNFKHQESLTKIKEIDLNKILMEINNTVTNTDTKIWAQQMQAMYTKWVEKQNNKKQDPQSQSEGIEEMDRKIKHLESQIKQMDKSSEKIILKREKEIYKKTKENAELIFDLNEMRKENKTLTRDKVNQEIKIDTLQKEIAMMNQQISCFQKDGQKKLQRPQTQGNFSQSQHMQRPQSMRISQQPNKGNIKKGTNFDSKTLGIFDRAKMKDMAAEAEMQAQKLIYFDSEIKNLRYKIKKHIEEKGCKDPNFEEEIYY